MSTPVEPIVILLERIAVALESIAKTHQVDEAAERSEECIWGLLAKAAAEQVQTRKKTAALTLSMLRRYDLKTWSEVKTAFSNAQGHIRGYSRVSHEWFVAFAAEHGVLLPTADDLGWPRSK